MYVYRTCRRAGSRESNEERSSAWMRVRRCTYVGEMGVEMRWIAAV